jgi:putative transposase
MDDLPVRKRTRLKPFNYVGRQRYFVTLCCFRRRSVFSQLRVCEELLALLRSECASRGFSVLAYCLMPDHLHFLVEGMDPGCDLLQLMKSFRIKGSRRQASLGEGILWQKGFYEHILRASETVEAVAWYIWLNPVRRGLVSRAQEYPFAGSFTGMQMPASWEGVDWTPPWKKKR